MEKILVYFIFDALLSLETLSYGLSVAFILLLYKFWCMLHIAYEDTRNSGLLISKWMEIMEVRLNSERTWMHLLDGDRTNFIWRQ